MQEPTLLPQLEGNIAAKSSRAQPELARRSGPAGVEERGMHGEGSPGTWEALSSSRKRNRRVSESERSGGDGESECRNRSEEVGEPTRGTPRSKGRHRVMELQEGKMTETLCLEPSQRNDCG